MTHGEAGKEPPVPGGSPAAGVTAPPDRWWAWAILALVALFVVTVRVRLLDLPFERDEGEFALMGRMILDGIPPYAEAYNLKPPGIYVAYAGAMAIFGESPAGVRLGLLVVNLLSAALLFLIVGKLERGREGEPPVPRATTMRAAPMTAATTSATAAYAAAAFLALTSMPRLLGFSAHATHVLLLPALGGIFLLLPGRGRSASRGGLFAAGCLMGASFLVKQPGIFFILLGGVMVARDRWRALPWYGAGVVLPIGASLFWLWSAGVLDRFWFWVVTYALAYGAEVGVAEGLDIAWSVGSSVVFPAIAVWLLAAWGLLRQRGDRLFVIALLVASILAVSMGFHFRRHYFVLLLPVTAMLFAAGLGRLRRSLDGLPAARRLAGATVTVLCALSIGQLFLSGSAVYFSADENAASREMFGANPFVESRAIGEYVRKLTPEGDRIAVVGSEPQIYFYADRRPATGYLYTYGLVEHHPHSAAMLAEMTSEIERERPAVIVYVQVPSSWLLRPESDLSVFAWFREYRLREGYQLVGLVELPPTSPSIAIWGEEAASHRRGSNNVVEIWKR